jgi:hypothetical protein
MTVCVLLVRAETCCTVFLGVIFETAQRGTGAAYDYALDGAFAGETICVLEGYTGEGGTVCAGAVACLEKKGFNVRCYCSVAPCLPACLPACLPLLLAVMFSLLSGVFGVD